MLFAVPLTVVRLAARLVTPVLVKANVPSPPTVFLTRVRRPRLVFVKVQVVVLPASTWIALMFELVSVPVTVVPSASLQTAPVRSQPLGTVSPTA